MGRSGETSRLQHQLPSAAYGIPRRLDASGQPRAPVAYDRVAEGGGPNRPAVIAWTTKLSSNCESGPGRQ